MPPPPAMLFKPSTERVNTISSVWRETFEGKSNEDIDRFMKSFEIHCKLVEVKDEELCNMLWLHLKGRTRTGSGHGNARCIKGGLLVNEEAPAGYVWQGRPA
jgi:hypothetical protein